ncbi:hypothetical protein BLL42_22320 [Pseudomonas frederiksbergensis]|uniref:Uncharacterized protein n=1 Tax=Pseudomonas frederiksbergensis TaxID=104087 RepID=A0A1J0ER95_9PSED|nr:hypothetical protein BLL42_22320 [Pseudomonas frederiksbergensis]
MPTTTAAVKFEGSRRQGYNLITMGAKRIAHLTIVGQYVIGVSIEICCAVTAIDMLNPKMMQNELIT